jgi:hypothetical protein
MVAGNSAMLIKKACDMLDSWFVWLYRIRPEEPVVAKNMVLGDIRRALTYFLIEEVSSNVDAGVMGNEIERFLQEEAARHDAKKLAKWVDPPEEAVGIFLKYLKSKGIAEEFKLLWH